MLRFSVTTVIAFVLFAPASQAVVFLLLTDEFDDTDTIQRAREDPEVKALGKEMEALRHRLYPFKERDFEALFGKPTLKPNKKFAMPVAQPRGLGLSGLHYANPKMNKDHTAFYSIGDFAGIEVYYHIDGVSPQAILIYLRVDKDFLKLSKDNLTKRLSWERERIRRLVHFFEEQRAKVFVWEVDSEAEKKFYQGDYALDPNAKLESWLATCKKLGYRLKVKPFPDEGSRYLWYRPDGSLAREVYSRYKQKTPGEFIWYHKDGWLEYRRESYQGDRINLLRWGRSDKSSNIRFESTGSDGRPVSWTWEGPDGKLIRSERDANGDGIPDIFVESEDDKVGRRLRLEESWAIHPELIPAGSRIPDQPDRRVPLRKITLPRKKGD